MPEEAAGLKLTAECHHCCRYLQYNTISDVKSELQKVLGPWDEKNYFHPKMQPGFFKENAWIFKEAAPYKGAASCLKNLKRNFNIVYLSARPSWAFDMTKNWLKEHGFPEGEIIFTNDKAETAVRMGILLAIEDAPHEIRKLRYRGIQVLIKRQPYNTEMMNYGTIFDWNDARQL